MASRLGEPGGSAHPAEVSCGVKASPPSEDQGVCLALATTAPDDKVHAAAHGPRCSGRIPIVRQGSGGLPTLILCLPLSPSGVASDRGQPPRCELRGDILAVSWLRYISSRS